MNLNWRYLDSAGAAHVGWSPATEDQPLSPYERMAAQMAEIRQMGCTAVLLPPSTKGAAGAFSGGYDLFDPYDLGSKDQCGSIPTAYGTAEQLRQLVAVIHRYEMQGYGDLVVHQYDGGTADGGYTYKGANDVEGAGRWPKTNTCFAQQPDFVGGVTPDEVPDEEGNFGFGLLAAYQNAKPPGYMWNGAIANAAWLVDSVGLDGLRIDDAKGTCDKFVYALLTSSTLRSMWPFAEYYDGDTAKLWNYVHNLMQGKCAVLDFTFKFNVQNICNHTSSVWMGALANIGYCNIDPANAVTFCESADTDTSPGEQIVYNKILGYAIMLTFPGYPMIYYRDWSTDPGCYGLKNEINNLAWIHEYLAQGDFVVRLDTDPQVFVHERMGFGDAPGCVCAFNNDEYTGFTRTVQTHFGPNRQMHDYTYNGSVDDIWTDESGNLTIEIPPNNNGNGFVIYGPAGVTGGFGSTPIEQKQILHGAVDLDIGCMGNPTLIEDSHGDKTLTVGRFWCAKGTYLSATLTPDQTDWGNSTQIMIEMLDAVGELDAYAFDDQGDDTQGFTARTTMAGWHTIELVTSGLPPAGSAFSLKVNYTGAPM